MTSVFGVKSPGPDEDLIAQQERQLEEERAEKRRLEQEASARRRALTGGMRGRSMLLGGPATGVRHTHPYDAAPKPTNDKLGG